jgi:hypothetical protein
MTALKCPYCGAENLPYETLSYFSPQQTCEKCKKHFRSWATCTVSYTAQTEERHRTEMLKELTKVKYDFPDCPGVLDRVKEELRNTEERCRENAEVER